MEIFVAVSMGIFVYSLVYLLLQKQGAEADTIRRRLDRINNITKKNFVLDEEINKPLSERLFRPMLKSIADALAKVMPRFFGSDDANATGKGGRSQNGKLKAMLVQAGYSLNATEYNAIRFFTIIGAGLLFVLSVLPLHVDGSGVLLAFLFGASAGFIVMRFTLTATITSRQKKIEQQLPDVLDLLSISVEAGLGFEQALNHIINRMKGPLIDELTVTYREMTMGRSRRDALIQLGERCGIEDLKTFTGALVQAGQLGIPMRNLLRSQADAIRQTRRARMQEKAMKVSVKIIFPMLLFIFPVIFVVILGPAVVSVMHNLNLK